MNPRTRPSARERQAADTNRFPLLLSDANGGLAVHRLFEATDAAQLYFDAASALRALQELAWTSRNTSAEDPVESDGWFFFLSYEAAACFLPDWCELPTDPSFPLLSLQRVRLVEHSQEELPDSSPQALLPRSAWQEDQGDSFLRGVESIHDYILAGDIYQANLSRRWQASAADTDASEIYLRLLQNNPAPFAARAVLPGFEILSSSPERLFELRGNTLRTQPIAGTRPRGRGQSEDERLRRDLAEHPKEIAEHLMLVDLERNDLGRICAAGSVKVPRLMSIEPFRSVQHIVSEVSGQIPAGTGLAEILAAVFPGGTITGCPKVRCMQILAELEGRPRLAYTGSLGYCLDSGQVDCNILIRSLLLRGGEISLDAGAGIVADSQAAAELNETRAKARGVIDALAGGPNAVV